MRPNQLYKWRESIGNHANGAFPGSGRQADKDTEIARLKRLLEDVTEERDIPVYGADFRTIQGPVRSFQED